mmetsp:Transcript_37353/g.42898  ORF Transcript_37353/g.42898 Transcript_37353/m.42898 type:complete len:130 (-) Transcript_37353:950-1339(-)
MSKETLLKDYYQSNDTVRGLFILGFAAEKDANEAMLLNLFQNREPENVTENSMSDSIMIGSKEKLTETYIEHTIDQNIKHTNDQNTFRTIKNNNEHKLKLKNKTTKKNPENNHFPVKNNPQPIPTPSKP